MSLLQILTFKKIKKKTNTDLQKIKEEGRVMVTLFTISSIYSVNIYWVRTLQVLYKKNTHEFPNFKELVISKEKRREKIIANHYKINPLRGVQSGFRIQRGVLSFPFEVITFKELFFLLSDYYIQHVESLSCITVYFILTEIIVPPSYGCCHFPG